MRSQFPYNCVHILIFLVNLMVAYLVETCFWINAGKTIMCDWMYCDSCYP